MFESHRKLYRKHIHTYVVYPYICMYACMYILRTECQEIQQLLWYTHSHTHMYNEQSWTEWRLFNFSWYLTHTNLILVQFYSSFRLIFFLSFCWNWFILQCSSKLAVILNRMQNIIQQPFLMTLKLPFVYSLTHSLSLEYHALLSRFLCSLRMLLLQHFHISTEYTKYTHFLYYFRSKGLSLICALLFTLYIISYLNTYICICMSSIAIKHTNHCWRILVTVTTSMPHDEW